MKKRVLGWLMVVACGALQACEVRARWNDDPPFAMRLADGRIGGLNVELVEQTLARMGCKAQWLELPWARALVELEAGRLDLLPGGFRRPEREPYAFFVADHELSQNRLFVRKADRASIAAATRLAEVARPGWRLGVQIGVVYGPEYADLLAQPQFRARLTQATARRSLWQMLELGRVDGVLSSEVSARWELQQAGLADAIVPTGVLLSHEPAYVLISRRSRDAAWAERYQQAFAGLKADGGMARIVHKYLGD